MFSSILNRISTSVHGDSPNAAPTTPSNEENLAPGIETTMPTTHTRTEQRSNNNRKQKPKQRQGDRVETRAILEQQAKGEQQQQQQQQQQEVAPRKRGRPPKGSSTDLKRPKQETSKAELKHELEQQQLEQEQQLRQQQQQARELQQQKQQLELASQQEQEEASSPNEQSSPSPSGSGSSNNNNNFSWAIQTLACPKGQLCCPYKGCGSKPTPLPHSLYRHIRTKHFPDFPKLSPSCMYIFRTTSGQKFKFDENARDLLEEGAPIMTERIFRSLIELRYHCPYKRCHGRFYYSANDIRSHLESRHPVVNPSEGDFSKLIFTTAAGKRIKLEDENITNSLDDDMAINISVETRSRPKKDGTFYCPYKNCSNICYLYRRDLYRHIRGKHQEEFPQLKYNGRNLIFTTEEGMQVYFDESSRNTLEFGTKIVVHHNEDKIKYRCPYKGCRSRHGTVSSLIRHIRPAHDSTLPTRRQGTREKCVFTGPSGMVVNFDDISRNTLNEGEQLTMTEVPLSPIP